MRCLIVEDSITARRTLTRALAAIGSIEVVMAESAEQALALCDGSISLAIINWNMARGGMDLVREIRAQPDCAAVRILVTSTRSSRDAVEQALAAGVDDYLLKPFTNEALRNRILDLLATRSDQPAA
jgi:DNA-binding response OmpR family regulator